VGLLLPLIFMVSGALAGSIIVGHADCDFAVDPPG
jgi:hypothetical protein